ncbi:hypothetical protein TREAZ_0313 [Leadbettera azotonutricia ZAS-9]|uniref:Uncharacterized protein n=1 Tax=Leadbettera azotonutricia (strain ATCC BAA-888 / DSM 13862 / ZAS-9) TaxID=545695 RepID=F5YDK9_LEAAZ|nr:hypothetical protein TREAZ_0313 [Leadbettera azotonutricia ZAS-9]
MYFNAFAKPMAIICFLNQVFAPRGQGITKVRKALFKHYYFSNA